MKFSLSIAFICLIFHAFAENFTLPYSSVTTGFSSGKYIGIDKDYADLAFFFPLYKNSNKYIPFLASKGYFFTDSGIGANLGIGARVPTRSGVIYGINAYYDYLNSSNGNNFHRAGIGIEWLSNFLDFRANGYIPVGDQEKNYSNHSKQSITGRYEVQCRDYESIISNGFDAEIGLTLGMFEKTLFYLAAGPYYYYENAFNNFCGCHARLSVNWGSWATLQARTSYDTVYHWKAQLRLQVSIPFDFFTRCSSTPKKRCIFQPVEREGLIFLKKHREYTWKNQLID